MTEKFDRLKTLLAEIEDLDRVIALLNWDRETYMPPGGNESRSNQLATLDRMRHARLSSDELGLPARRAHLGNRRPRPRRR